MEVTTIFGLVLAVFCMVYGIITGGNAGVFIDPTSIFITIGGTIATVIMAFPLKTLKGVGGIIGGAFQNKDIDVTKDISMILQIANVARKEGLLALEDAVSDLENPFLKKGIMLIVDGSDPELIKNIMETELYFIQDRHSEGVAVLDMVATMGPAFGMIGTLVGLINMLQQLSDPGSLGPSMAVALITTLYGSMLANIFALPLARKLRIWNNKEYVQKQLLLEGMLSIQDGENPRIIRDKLTAFISRTELAVFDATQEPSATVGGEVNA